MEKLDLNNQTLLIIAGVVLLVIVALIFLIRRKKKNGSKASSKKSVEVQEVVGKKYKGNEPTEEQLEAAPRLVLEKFDDGPRSLSFRFKIKGGKIKLDEIDPYDNKWISVLNYNELVGQVRSHGDILHIFMNRKERFRNSHPEKAIINIVYRQDGGKQWIQQLKYNSASGIELGALKVLN